MSIGIAFQAFFAALFKRDAAERIRAALVAKPENTNLPAPTVSPPAQPSRPTPPAEPVRSEALTLLSSLQREARLLDLVHESLDQFEDAQIGAAAREVLRDARKTLDRMFDISSLTDADEGESLAVEAGASPNRLRLVGKSQGTTGVVVHRGWKANRCEVPKWSGRRDEAFILAPVEVEVN
ncbi:MAG: DUF2760 domain-containing protein [Pirellulaceae bacterium]